MTSDTRVAVLTGAFGGIGRGILSRLRSDGYRVVAVDRVIPNDVIPDDGVIALDADISDPAAAATISQTALDRFGQLDVLVNCAGVLRDKRSELMDVADFSFVVGINLAAAYRLTAAALPALRESGSGRVVSIASRAWLGMFGSSNYSASKGGLVGMTRALALAEGANGITANALSPGFIQTAMTTHLNPDIPVNRPGTPQDIARAVAFLIAPEAGYITGQTLPVCGGRSLQP
jgi:3-oxoacyl-[acyl-carrier protein] reductase